MHHMKLSEKQMDLINTLAKCEDIEDAEAYYHDLLGYRKEIVENSQITTLSKIIEAFSHEDRMFILSILIEKDRCVCELEAILDKSQSTISYHLKILENIDLIRGWKKGKFTHYSVVRSTLETFKKMFNLWIDEEKIKQSSNIL